jgi:outer membrane protein TolC
MQSMMTQMGIDLKGLRKDQYRVGVDVSQMVYDGGTIKSHKELVRRQGEMQTAQHEVTMYQIRQRVNDLYFGILLLKEQIQLNHDLQALLSSNEQKLASMFKRGTASESDYNLVKAERLSVVQQATSLESRKKALTMMLSTFCGKSIDDIGVSLKEMANTSTMSLQGASVKCNRPELKLIMSQLNVADAQEKVLDASLLPKFSLFAQGYYGYPGYNMFDDMLRHQWSLNGIIGARLSWNIGALYTRKNDLAKIRLQRETAETSRDAFLFNNQLEQIQQNEEIAHYRKLMADDAEIISLRSSVRKAAESKLSHGIIDASDLVKEINSENAAKLQQSIHEIQLLKAIYDLKNTTNN